MDVIKPNSDFERQGFSTFQCDNGFCLYEEDGGMMIAYATKPEDHQAACAVGDIVVLAFPGKNLRCNKANRLVLTAQELAIKGAVEIRFPARAAL